MLAGEPALTCPEDIARRVAVEVKAHGRLPVERDRRSVERDLPPLRAMTPKRLSIAAGGVALLALLVVGLVQLAGSSPSPVTRPSKLTLAQMRARLAGSPAPLAAPARAGERAAAGRTDGRQGAPGGAARATGRDQQVGVVVRALSRGVRRLPARIAGARAPGGVHRHRLGRHEPRERGVLPAQLPGELSELLRPQRRGRHARSPTRRSRR